MEKFATETAGEPNLDGHRTRGEIDFSNSFFSSSSIMDLPFF